MPLKMIRQTSFTFGEVDVQNFKRTDVAEYLAAAQSLLNAEVATTGLAKKRKGTAFLLDVTIYTDPNSQLFEYVDNNGIYYIIMSTNLNFVVFQIVDEAAQFYQLIPGTPYRSEDLQAIDYTLDNDVLVLTHPLYPPARIFISLYGTPNLFAYQVLDIFPYPAFDFGNINYNNFTVSASVSGSGLSGSVLTFSFTGLAGDPGYTTAWIGGVIIGGGSTVEQPLGYAIITNVVPFSGGTVTFTATVQVPFATPFSPLGSQYSIRQPAFSATLGWPAKVLFYQNRLWFANTKTLPNTIFGSRINAPTNFDVGTGLDTDAIVYTIGQTNTGGINWLNGGKQLEVYCQNYEFACPQQENIALTPATFSVRQQSAYGSSNFIKPITYINDSYYVSKTGKSIINFHFNGIGLTYTSTNISAHSQHLVKNPLNRALLRGDTDNQDNFIYFLNSDDTVTTFQFASEYKLAALTPMEFESDDLLLTENDQIITDESGNALNTEQNVSLVPILDIVAVNNQIYFLKNYEFNNVYALEVFDDNIKLDSYMNLVMQTSGLITGLDLLNNYTVDVYFNGQDFGQYMVTGGQITVDNPNGYSGEAQVGMLYDFVVTPMYIFAGANESNFFKQITRIYVDYYNSLDFEINGTLIPYQIFANIQAGLPLIPQTDTAIVDPTLGWDRFQTFSITQSSPFDCQIIAIAYEVDEAII